MEVISGNRDLWSVDHDQSHKGFQLDFRFNIWSSLENYRVLFHEIITFVLHAIFLMSGNEKLCQNPWNLDPWKCDANEMLLRITWIARNTIEKGSAVKEWHVVQHPPPPPPPPPPPHPPTTPTTPILIQWLNSFNCSKMSPNIHS